MATPIKANEDGWVDDPVEGAWVDDVPVVDSLGPSKPTTSRGVVGNVIETGRQVGIGARAGLERRPERATTGLQKTGYFAGRYGPGIAGATAAGALLAGPPGAAAGFLRGVAVPAAAEAVGAGLGSLAGQTAGKALGGRPVSGREAALEAAGAGGGGLMFRGAGAALTSKPAQKLGAGILRAFPNIPMNKGEAVLRDPSILWRWMPKETVKQAYEAFERVTGLKGLRGTSWTEGKFPSFDKLVNVVSQTEKKLIENPQSVTPQELYYASQASNAIDRSMRGASGSGPSEAAKQGMAIGIDAMNARAGKAIDAALEAVRPEYGSVRKLAFESSVGEAFSHLAPQTAQMSPNALRLWSAGATAAGGLAAGSPAGLLAPVAISPRAWGTGIMAANLASKAVPRSTGAALGLLMASPTGEKVRVPAQMKGAYEQRGFKAVEAR